MKILFSLKIILTLFFCSSFILSDATTNFEIKPEFSNVQKVFICGGKYAKKFHSSQTCKGLNNCKSNIYSVSSQQSAKSKGFSACSLCWK